MQYYLRFLCYNGPDRQSTTQIHPYIPIDEPVEFGYGMVLNIGNDSDERSTWPAYVVAHIPQMEQIKDPEDLTKNALLFSVFVAPIEE